MTAPAKPTIDEFPLTDEFIADIESGNVCDAECEAAAKYLRHYKHITEAAEVPSRYEFDINEGSKSLDLREKRDGRFMLADEVLPLLAHTAQMKAEPEAQQAKHDALVKDAERYRHLRNRVSGDRYPSGVARFRLPDIQAHEGIFRGELYT